MYRVCGQWDMLELIYAIYITSTLLTLSLSSNIPFSLLTLSFSSSSSHPLFLPQLYLLLLLALQVIRSGRRTHINIPHSCWSRIGEVFSSIINELPYEESASASGSEEEGWSGDSTLHEAAGMNCVV